MDLDEDKRPHVIGDFRKAPFQSEWFDLILFDPPWLTDRRLGNLLYDYVWRGARHFAVWKNRREQLEGVMWGLIEIGRLLRPGGRCVFKWGSGSGVDIGRMLAYRPSSLVVVEIKSRPSRGGRKETTWHAVLQKR